MGMVAEIPLKIQMTTMMTCMIGQMIVPGATRDGFQQSIPILIKMVVRMMVKIQMMIMMVIRIHQIGMTEEMVLYSLMLLHGQQIQMIVIMTHLVEVLILIS